MNHIPTLSEIQEAHERIKPFIHHTPVLTSASINQLAGCEIYFKCENFQKIGAFKARGGMNAVLSLSPEEQEKGITTHSSGNHAQAIALAAIAVGTKAYIVMPSNAPNIKKNGVKALNGEIIECEPTLEARESTVQQVIERTGATFVHPFNNYDVIAGQATATVELIGEVTHLDVIMAPVGGGGLLSGTALATHYLLPNAEVIAGEPEGAADAVLSFQTGKVEKAPYIKTIADGLMTTLGDKTLEIIRKYVKDIIIVSDEEIIAAMKLIWERLKIVIEPSCAVPFAALLKEKERFKGKRVGIILTGGNVDLGKLPF
ncbi:Pyridoxal-5'-phosphate-dependent protein beta subunit [Emticicia oligotrophica DSM 17448]|uniref:Pyridoxal-5'-phosphate-dependent protein beta subunit n=1 Tax=Emticicia oligotrophica (strain DSM 17448 / CIP 109782 / MTCC 6937 / GPTSA100-15) TaxID=929562 RepID=A0ABM5N5J9_EMTOG|nr:pyridoxal-phosphate dependent enzyme [Emticicia oligotrophica]AFK04753.1 Pyridoxal-5'-phosphate-dependent protein beta subunit [Emticicia oligotrophica DSM 17448]